MPFVTPTVRRRVLITGETGSGKTFSLRSTPAPRVILVFPGEHGHDTLVKPDGSPLDPETTVLVWEHDEKKTSTQVIDEVRKETIKVLQIPGLQSFCGDGYHKLHEYVMDALSGGEFFKGSPFKTESGIDSAVVDPRIASQAEHWMSDYLTMVCQSKVPYVFFTCWDKDTGVRRAKQQADGKKEKWTDIPQHKMPALYSAASRRILGQFGVCVHASAIWKRVAPGSPERVRDYRWQTVPDNEVGACAVKGDDAVTKLIPKFIPANWPALAKYLQEAPAPQKDEPQ